MGQWRAVGLISDTHGLLRPEVFHAFERLDLILHAGDIGDETILTELATIAPVHAVYGNTDGFPLVERLSHTLELELGSVRVVVTHGHRLGSPSPERLRAAHPAADVIVYGHTHKPLVDEANGRLVVNPGAAGPARFRLRPSVAILELSGRPSVRLIELEELRGQ